jgi:hypothetical protein
MTDEEYERFDGIDKYDVCEDVLRLERLVEVKDTALLEIRDIDYRVGDPNPLPRIYGIAQSALEQE